MQLFKFEKVDGEKYTLQPNPANEPVVQQPMPYSVRIAARE
jgi:hypothetical protein